MIGTANDLAGLLCVATVTETLKVASLSNDVYTSRRFLNLSPLLSTLVGKKQVENGVSTCESRSMVTSLCFSLIRL